jgi:tetratricopeptide (TPR) repeat protein
MALLGLRWRARRRPEDGNNWLALARGLLAGGDVSEAREAARNAARWPLQVRPALELAGQMEAVGDAATARGLYEAAVRSAPDDADAAGFLGLFLLRLGQTDDAIDALRAAVRLAPGVADGHAFLAEALRLTGALGEALDHVKRALTIDPSNVGAQVRLGRIHAAMGNEDAALVAFRAAYALDPQDFEAALALGSALARADFAREAIAIFQILLERDPACVEALINCGMAHAAVNEPQAAMRALREAIRLRPDVPEAHCDLGIVQMQLGQTDAAIFSFRSAVALAPDSPDAHLQLGLALRERGARDAAGVHLEAAMRNSSPASETHQFAAEALRALTAVAGRRALEPVPPPDMMDDGDPEALPWHLPGRPVVEHRVSATPSPPPPTAPAPATPSPAAPPPEVDEELVEPGDELIEPGDEAPPAAAARVIAPPAWPKGVAPRGTPTLEPLAKAGPTPAPSAAAQAADAAVRPSLRPDSGPIPSVTVSRTPAPVAVSVRPPEVRAPSPAPRPLTGPVAAAEAAEGASAFTGNLKMFTLPNLLEFLRVNTSTGTLFLRGKRGTGEVHLRNGMLIGAAASRAPRLGDILVRTGQLKRDDLDKFISLQRAEETADSLGSLLIERKAINERGLRAAIIAQIHASMAELIAWEDGNFSFDKDEATTSREPGGVRVELACEMVVLEALRRVDEQRRG